MVNPEKLQINVQFRSMVIIAIGIVFCFVVAMRLWYLQIINGEEFRQKSENNRIRRVFIPPPRGLILDRDGKVLVKNRPSFNIEFIKEDAPNPDETLQKLSVLIGEPVDALKQRVKGSKKRRRFEPKVLLKDVSRDLLAKVSAKRYELPGVIINVVPAREYIYGQLGAHALGYIREISSSQLERQEYSGYAQGDIVGQFGLEKKWERYLQGKRGLQAVIVDATGNRIGEASFDKETAGHSLTTTLDFDVQLAAEQALGDRKGSVVAMDPNTGEVLALVSHPAFDPNMFTKELSEEDWKDLTTGKEKKLSNRATQGTFPPGSVFKVFMAAAGLSESLATPQTSVNCPGYFNFVGRNFKCHKHSGHGAVNLYDALVLSCDVYFYILGNKLGVDRIHQYASYFGLGERTGIDIGDEAIGIIPSTAWKKSYYKTAEMQKWYAGETLSVVIGQGATTTTPLQLTRGIAAVVNGGKVLRPFLEKRLASLDGSFLDDNFHPEIQHVADVDKKVLDTVRQGMVGVVNDPRGTGKKASLMKEFGISVGGKTGTAQVASLEYHKTGTDLDHHAWFSGYAPAENPQIVVTALVENGGGGGAAAAPVVKATMEAFFAKRMPRLDGNVEAAAQKGIATVRSSSSTSAEIDVPEPDTPASTDTEEEHSHAD
jgi:penicillin-binding protein 2